MKVYLNLILVSLQQEMVYRFNFLILRVRNLFSLILAYFLWNSIFSNQSEIFGYNKDQIFTYILMVLLIRGVVLANRSLDNVGGEISGGNLSNYLLKPVNYFKYWLSRDISYKLLSICFISLEILIFVLFTKPQVYFPSDLPHLIVFLGSAMLAAIIFYFLSMTFLAISFWSPENTWGANFILLVITEILGGIIFPLDILPPAIQQLLSFTPFPYLVFYPLQIYLQRFDLTRSLTVVLSGTFILAVLYILCKIIWKQGLKSYASEGR